MARRSAVVHRPDRHDRPGPGGDTALRAAALSAEAAPALAAVVAVGAHDGHDAYRGADGPGGGGGRVAHDRGSGGFAPPLTAGAAALAAAAAPPDPRYAGDAWRDLWARRLAALDAGDPAAPEDAGTPLAYDAVRVPVLAVAGWHDPRRDTVLRLLEHLPRHLVRGVLGPWPCRYPDRGEPPGPAVGFLQETLRWWDHHLKGLRTGAMDEPLLRSWTRGWRGDDTWPPPHVTPVTYALQGGPAPVRSPLHTGLDAGRFAPSGGDADLPPDQRAEDALSACFDVAVPSGGPPVEVLGHPVVRLAVRADGPAARVTVRLCDVAPDGTSVLVARGTVTGASGTHTVRCGATGHAFPPGHRIRVAVSSAYWPWVWPLPAAGAPAPGDTRARGPAAGTHGTRAAAPSGDPGGTPPGGFTLDPAGCSLLLPVRAPAPHDAAVGFPGPEQAPPLGVGVPAMLGAPDGDRPPLLVVRDVARGVWRLEADACSGEHGSVRAYPDGLELTERAVETYEIDEGAGPLSARMRAEWQMRWHRPDLDPPWHAAVEVRAEAGYDTDGLLVRTELVCTGTVGEGVDGGDEVLLHRTWEKHLPRP
ncbi:CocE/NonD family hydrolase [Streptomyces sp. CC210A]|uniref:CocE/NonD family hydrolase n=1 Tax=Streptomyces sp. CC210A TaxID=2898184 RepID=UPI0035A90B5D